MKTMLYAATALALLGASSPALAKTKPVEAAVTASTLSGEPLADSLPAYAAFQADISLVNGGSIQGPKDIERTLDKAAALNRDALTRGIIAYGALAAARNPQFADSIRKTAKFYGRDKMVNGLLLQPRYASSMEGADAAMATIVRLARADSARILTAGESLKQRAREAQNISWGKDTAGSAGPRTMRLKALAAAASSPTISAEMAGKLIVTPGDPSLDPASFGGESFWRTISAPPLNPSTSASAKSGSHTVTDATFTSLPTTIGGYSSSSGGSEIRAKMLSLAGLYALNATADRPADTERLLNDNITNGCLQGAQLQFYQCVASAKFNYENMACIGEAGLITVGSCVKDLAR